MPDAWILRGKLAPPSQPADWLSRGFAASAAPVLLLVGGPGAGKTLGLLEIVEAARHAGQPTVWYSGDERDADAASLFHHLIAGVEAHIPQFGDPVRALLGGDGADTRDPARPPGSAPRPS